MAIDLPFKKKILKNVILLSLLILAFFLRVKLFPYKTHWSDMYFWKDWGEGIVKLGTRKFYPYFNADYLPFYPLILGLVYRIYKVTDSWHQLPIHYFYKFPASLADIFLGFLIFKILAKKSPKFAFLAAIFFLFNPAIFANSSLWGQMDVIGTLFVVLGLYFFVKKNFFLLGGSLALALSTKTLYFLSLPVFVLATFLTARFEKKRIFWFFKKQLAFFSILLIIMWLIASPFTDFSSTSYFDFLTRPFVLLLERYLIISARYPYTTVNAFNFWGIVDKSFWLSDARTFGPFTDQQWGMLANILLITLILVNFALRQKGEIFYQMNLALALIFFSSFFFLTRMHERHLYYVFPFLLLAAVKNKRLLGIYLTLSLIYLFNLHFAWEYLYQNKKYVFSWPLINFLSLVNFLVFIWLFIEFFLLKRLPSEKHDERKAN